MLSKSIQNPIETPYLDWIKSGKKIYEGRLYSKVNEWNLHEGNTIKFFDQDNPESYVVCNITELLKFEDFGTAYDVLGDKLIIGSTKNKVVRMYNKLFDPENYANLADGVTSDIICKVGVVAIGISIVEQK